MEELFKKLKTLKSISSTNDKKRFIKANKNYLLFKTTLKFLLDPYVVTNISKKKIEKKVKVEADEEIINLKEKQNIRNKELSLTIDYEIYDKLIEKLNNKGFSIEEMEGLLESLRNDSKYLNYTYNMI